jgi:hypothetical protein
LPKNSYLGIEKIAGSRDLTPQFIVYILTFRKEEVELPHGVTLGSRSMESIFDVTPSRAETVPEATRVVRAFLEKYYNGKPVLGY